MNKKYLGDGVYVDVVDGTIKLTTNREVSGTGCSVDHEHKIYLEDAVLVNFLKYVEEFKKEKEKKTKNGITAKNGLLYRDGVMLDVQEADAVARENGVIYAEQYVAFLEAKQKESES